MRFYPWALFFPLFFGIINGQDSAAVGLLLCIALVLLANDRDAAGGAVLSLTLYKFNLFLLMPIYLAARGRYRALSAYGLCGAVLAGISAALERPSVYLSLLPRIQEYTIGFFPESMLGLRGLLASIGWAAAYPVAALLTAVYLLVASRRMEFVQGYGMAVTACVLCPYHGTWYDGAVMAIPLGLALLRPDASLRMLAVGLICVPLWNAWSLLVTTFLIAFALLYSTSPRSRYAEVRT